MRTFLLAVLGIAVGALVGGCGSEAATASQYTITGPASVAQGSCTKYTVARLTADGSPANAATGLIIQPSLKSGQGAVYADSGCTQLAVLNVQIAAGGNTVDFYFKASTSAGTTVLKASSLFDAVIEGNITVTVI